MHHAPPPKRNLYERSARFRTMSDQEVVQACLREKYPDGSVEKVVATSPDLAIVQGAAHYAPLHKPAPRGGALVRRDPPPADGTLQYPTAPQYNVITAPSSYGIMTTQVGQAFIILSPRRFGVHICVEVNRLFSAKVHAGHFFIFFLKQVCQRFYFTWGGRRVHT